MNLRADQRSQCLFEQAYLAIERPSLQAPIICRRDFPIEADSVTVFWAQIN